MVKNKIKNATYQGNKEELVDDYVVFVFKYMIENQLFEDESFRIGLLTNKIHDYQSFCQYYDFRISTEKPVQAPVRVVAKV